MRKYNGINRKKIMFIFGMVLIIATSFFYLNNEEWMILHH